ncbi:hypothetical protein [Mycoplasmopsis felifaucium]|uniref:hypothetical protein n=1 Tax=Mycoplasmopsis felifaucium TaxID=35768 RepID=UPI00048938CB|nr:hypothetical protein [Mycoplasmopsis felifaucium]
MTSKKLKKISSLIIGISGTVVAGSTVLISSITPKKVYEKPVDDNALSNINENKISDDQKTKIDALTSRVESLISVESDNPQLGEYKQKLEDSLKKLNDLVKTTDNVTSDIINNLINNIENIYQEAYERTHKALDEWHVAVARLTQTILKANKIKNKLNPSVYEELKTNFNKIVDESQNKIYDIDTSVASLNNVNQKLNEFINKAIEELKNQNYSEDYDQVYNDFIESRDSVQEELKKVENVPNYSDLKYIYLAALADAKAINDYSNYESVVDATAKLEAAKLNAENWSKEVEDTRHGANSSPGESERLIDWLNDNTDSLFGYYSNMTQYNFDSDVIRRSDFLIFNELKKKIQKIVDEYPENFEKAVGIKGMKKVKENTNNLLNTTFYSVFNSIKDMIYDYSINQKYLYNKYKNASDEIKRIYDWNGIESELEQAKLANNVDDFKSHFTNYKDKLSLLKNAEEAVSFLKNNNNIDFHPIDLNNDSNIFNNTIRDVLNKTEYSNILTSLKKQMNSISDILSDNNGEAVNDLYASYYDNLIKLFDTFHKSIGNHIFMQTTLIRDFSSQVLWFLKFNKYFTLSNDIENIKNKFLKYENDLLPKDVSNWWVPIGGIDSHGHPATIGLDYLNFGNLWTKNQLLGYYPKTFNSESEENRYRALVSNSFYTIGDTEYWSKLFDVVKDSFGLWDSVNLNTEYIINTLNPFMEALQKVTNDYIKIIEFTNINCKILIEIDSLLRYYASNLPKEYSELLHTLNGMKYMKDKYGNINWNSSISDLGEKILSWWQSKDNKSKLLDYLLRRSTSEELNTILKINFLTSILEDNISNNETIESKIKANSIYKTLKDVDYTAIIKELKDYINSLN